MPPHAGVRTTPASLPAYGLRAGRTGHAALPFCFSAAGEVCEGSSTQTAFKRFFFVQRPCHAARGGYMGRCPIPHRSSVKVGVFRGREKHNQAWLPAQMSRCLPTQQAIVRSGRPCNVHVEPTGHFQRSPKGCIGVEGKNRFAGVLVVFLPRP